MRRVIRASSDINPRNLKVLVMSIDKGLGDITEQLKAICDDADPAELEMANEVANMLRQTIEKVDNVMNRFWTTH